MQVYLLRHGIAQDAEAGQIDAERALTEAGKRKLEKVLGIAREAGLNPGYILSSPFRRALETAQTAAAVLKHREPIVETHALEPEAHPEQVWEEIRLHREQDQLLLASHEPLMSRTTAYLLSAPSLSVDFKKGAIVRIDIAGFGTAPRGVLRWMLIPKLAGAD